MFSCSSSFPKVSPKNIYHYRQKPGETYIAPTVNNEVSHDLKSMGPHDGSITFEIDVSWILLKSSEIFWNLVFNQNSSD